MKLEGRSALVTGGSRGIGRAIALELAREGADVAVNYLASEGPALEVAREIEKLGRRALAVRADVSDFPDTFRMAQEVLAAFGAVDILVNNAGINSDKTFAKMDHASWRKVLAINLDGVFNCTKVFVDSMLKKNYGRIVNITSVIGQIGNFGQANYAASKAGVTAMTKSLAKELAGKGITRQRRRPRLRRDRDGGLDPREGEAATPRSDSAAPLREGRGGGAGRDLPGLLRRRLHHRRGALDERRPLDALN